MDRSTSGRSPPRSPRRYVPALMEANGVPAPELRPLGIGEVLDVSIKIFLRNAVTFFKTVAVVVVPVQLLLIVVLSSALPDNTLLQPQFGTSPEAPFEGLEPAEIGASVAAFGLAGLANVIATTLATAACFKGVSDAYLGAEPTWRNSLGFARDRLGSLLWLTLLATLIIILGFVALIVPGIYLGLAFNLAAPVLLFEGLRGRKALGRALRLIRHRWWPTFGAIFLGFLLAGVVAGVVGGLFGVLVFTSAGDSVFGAVALNQVGAALGAVLATPFQAAVTAVIYFDLRVRKEGFDLELLSRRVGVAPTEDAGLGVATAPPPSAAGPPPTGPGWSGPPPPGAGPPPTGPGWSGPPPSGAEPPGQPPPPRPE